MWTTYRILFSLPEWIDELVVKPLIWVGPLIYLHKNNILQTIQSIKINSAKNIKFGFLIGLLYFVIYTGISKISVGLPQFNPDSLTIVQLILQMVIALSTGFMEEIIFRRFILERSLLLFHDSVVANSFTTVLFTLIHLPIIIFIYKYSLPATISYLSLIGISGFIYGLVYLKNKSLVASSTTHAVWNFLGTIIR